MLIHCIAAHAHKPLRISLWRLQGNLNQHLASRKHLTKAARVAAANAEAAAAAAAAAGGVPPNPTPTRVEVHRLCRQVMPPALNEAVLELLT